MRLKTREMVVFSMLGALMYVSKMALEFLPNVHLLAVLTISYTLVYRRKALYPIYLFVFLIGLLNGFSIWWGPYLYLWGVLWGVTMLLPKNMPKWLAPIVYMIVSGLHGLLYGTMYAPYQAIMFHLDFKGMVAWIIAGLPWDALHGFSNFCCGVLIVPLVTVLRLMERSIGQSDSAKKA